VFDKAVHVDSSFRQRDLKESQAELHEETTSSDFVRVGVPRGSMVPSCR
jgi:hypothetical protein